MPGTASGVLRISALEGTGVDELIEKITAAAARMLSTESSLVTRARHRESLSQCVEALVRASHEEREDQHSQKRRPDQPKRSRSRPFRLPGILLFLALTELLLPRISDRVVTVSSGALFLTRLAPGDVTANLGAFPRPEEIARTRARYDLDRSPA